MTEDDVAARTVPMNPEEESEYARELEEHLRLIHERIDQWIDQRIDQRITQRINDRIYSVWD